MKGKNFKTLFYIDIRFSVNRQGMVFKFPLHCASWGCMVFASYYQEFVFFPICLGFNAALGWSMLLFHMLGNDQVYNALTLYGLTRETGFKSCLFQIFIPFQKVVPFFIDRFEIRQKYCLVNFENFSLDKI